MSNNKCPEPFLTSVKEHKSYDMDCFDVAELRDWFIQCINDKPHVREGEDSVIRFALDMENWYIRWFIQFVENDS